MPKKVFLKTTYPYNGRGFDSYCSLFVRIHASVKPVSIGVRMVLLTQTEIKVDILKKRFEI